MKYNVGFGLLIATFLGLSLHAQQHPIICVVSMPRSLSTLFLRIMMAHGAFEVYNEPFIAAYWSQHYDTETWFKKDAPRTYEQAKQIILDASKKHPVFLKEMSRAMIDFLSKNADFLENKYVQWVFLLRNPHPTLISCYKKLMKDPAVEQFTKAEIHKLLTESASYKTLYAAACAINNSGCRKPYFLCAEDLYKRTEQTLQEFCTAISIQFTTQMLQWDDLSENIAAASDAWHDAKPNSDVALWHAEALHSTGISKPTIYEVDSQENPTFSEIGDEEDRAFCHQLYHENMYYYRLLLAQKAS